MFHDILKLGEEMQTQYLRAKEVAKLLNIGISSVWRHTREGRLPKPKKISSRTTVWEYSELIEFIQQEK